MHDHYKELGVDVGFLEVLPRRINRVVSDLAHLSVEFLELDSNIINLYWVWATARYHVFDTPEVLYQDIKAGPRAMLGRILSGDEQRVGKSLVKIARKVDPQGSWSHAKYEALLWALNNRHIMKSMRHTKKINSSLLVLLYEQINTKGVIFSQTKFVHQLLIDEEGHAVKGLVKEVLYWFKESVRITNALNIGEQYHYALIGLKGLNEVKRLHNNLADLVEKEYIEMKVAAIRSGRATYPPPPISGNGQIHPISHIDALLDEGEVMQHCVVSYIDDILKKRSYIYMMLEPERATITIDPSTYELQDFKLRNNMEPSEESWNCVLKWLRRNQGLPFGMGAAA